jgi:hypothetical protein
MQKQHIPSILPRQDNPNLATSAFNTLIGTINRAGCPSHSITPPDPKSSPSPAESVSDSATVAGFTILVQVYPHPAGQRQRRERMNRMLSKNGARSAPAHFRTHQRLMRRLANGVAARKQAAERGSYHEDH